LRTCTVLTIVDTACSFPDIELVTDNKLKHFYCIVYCHVLWLW